MATLEVPGVEDPRPEPSSLAGGLPEGTVRVKWAVHAQAARAGAGPARLEGVPPDDVVELEFRDGLRLWMRVEDLRADLSRGGGDQGADGVVRVPTMLPVGAASRGSAGAWAIRALKVLDIDIEGGITDFVSAHVEGRLAPGPGLYRCVEDPARALSPVRTLGGTAPVLVFLHGTASSTSGSFGGLWAGGPAARIKTLIGQYGGRVLALQHRTLTRSPIENARTCGGLARSSSRGGGRPPRLALARRVDRRAAGARDGRGAARSPRDELELFDAEGRKPDREALARLNGGLLSLRASASRASCAWRARRAARRSPTGGSIATSRCS